MNEIFVRRRDWLKLSFQLRLHRQLPKNGDFVGEKSGNDIGNIIASDTFVMFVFVYNERFS